MVNEGKGSGTSPDHGWALWIVSVVMVVISGLFVLIRIAIRTSRQMLGLDDHIIIATLITLIFLSLTECLAVANGYGKHQSDLTHVQVEHAFRWFYGAQITYKIAVCGYKLSILFLYLRIFTSKRFRYSCFVMIGLVSASSIAFIIVTIWQCSPISAFWNKTLLKPPVNGHCFDSEAFWFSYSLINILLDVLILFLPIQEIFKLQLPLREKCELIGVFLLGAFVCATSIIRTTTLAASATTKDPSWGYIPATVWSVVEANTGTICACLPMLKQPLSVFFPRLFRTTTSTLGLRNTDGSHTKKASSGNSYNLKPSSKNLFMKGRRGLGSSYTDAAGGTTLDYHQWALADGTIISSPKKQGSLSTDPESEENMVPLEVTEGGRPTQGGTIVRRTDVDVKYGRHLSGDDKTLPALPSNAQHV